MVCGISPEVHLHISYVTAGASKYAALLRMQGAFDACMCLSCTAMLMYSGQAVTWISGAMQAAGEGAPWACRGLFEGASCAMSDDWLLQQRRLQRARQQEAAERARDAAVAAAAQVRLRNNHASHDLPLSHLRHHLPLCWQWRRTWLAGGVAGSLLSCMSWRALSLLHARGARLVSRTLNAAATQCPADAFLICIVLFVRGS